jgi:MFS family permease
MPVLFKEISDDLSLSLVQVGMIWGMVGLAGLFTAFAYGLIGDRYGSRLTLGLACLLQGIAGALRGLSGDFTDLAIYMFLFGLFTVPLSFATHKAAGEWFSGRQLGLANGILAMGMGFGITLGSMISATVLSPLLGGWRNIMFVYGAVAVVIGFLWLQTRRPPSQGEAAQSTGTVSFRQALLRVMRIRSVWLLALVQMCLFGCRSGLTGYLPLYLRESGWTAVSADGALAALSAASMVGVVPLSLLSDRIGLRKVILYPVILMTILGVGLLSVFGGVIVWPLVILVGIVQEGFVAVLITMIMETEGVGAAYAGTALGLNTTFSGLGGFLAPSIGNGLAEINPSFAFLFWSFLATAALFVFHFVEETGWKKRKIYPERKAPYTI